MRCLRLSRPAIFLFGLSLWISAPRSGSAQAPQEPGTSEGRVWALLIGVEKYQHVSRLQYTINDVRQLAATLHRQGGLDRRQILEMTDDAPDPGRRPLRRAVMARVPEFLSQPGGGDRLILYFSGHGVRDREGTLYLAPLDCNPRDLAATAIPVAWLREQLSACKAALKLLVLDACHAGSEKGEDGPPGVSVSDLVRPFNDLAGVVTFASSTADETSQIWEEKQQSLYSFWLNQGFKGHADKDGDGAIELDELNEYVFRRVTYTAKARFSGPQTPVRIMHPTSGNPVLVQLQSQNLRQVLNDMAEQLAYEIEERHLGKVGVLEFTTIAGGVEVLGAHFGALGHRCADDLEKELMNQSAGKFRVVDRRRLQSALHAQKFAVEDLGSSEALRGVSRRVDGLPVLVQGMLQSRTGREVTLQCKLIQTESDELAGSVGGKALLDESERGMLGDSFVVRPEDRMPELPEPGKPFRPLVEQVVAKIDERTKEPHPLASPNFPFPVKFRIAGKVRPCVPRGNDWLLPVKKGEVFEIEVENRANRIICMRLLIDGLNWLPESDERAGDKGLEPFVWGKHVSLGEARYAVFDPARARVFGVRGYAVETGKGGKVREFVVSDVADSLAGRHGFTEQVGLITFAFYDQALERGGDDFGVKPGKQKDERLPERNDIKIGNPLAVVHVRLANAEKLGVRVP